MAGEDEFETVRMSSQKLVITTEEIHLVCYNPKILFFLFIIYFCYIVCLINFLLFIVSCIIEDTILKGYHTSVHF